MAQQNLAQQFAKEPFKPDEFATVIAYYIRKLAAETPCPPTAIPILGMIEYMRTTFPQPNQDEDVLKLSESVADWLTAALADEAKQPLLIQKVAAVWYHALFGNRGPKIPLVRLQVVVIGSFADGSIAAVQEVTQTVPEMPVLSDADAISFCSNFLQGLLGQLTVGGLNGLHAAGTGKLDKAVLYKMLKALELGIGTGLMPVEQATGRTWLSLIQALVAPPLPEPLMPAAISVPDRGIIKPPASDPAFPKGGWK